MDLDGERLLRCPRRPYLDAPRWYDAIFDAYRHRRDGFLSEEGTWRDQPVKLLSALDVVSVAVDDAATIRREAKERRERTQAAHDKAAARSKARGAR